MQQQAATLAAAILGCALLLQAAPAPAQPILDSDFSACSTPVAPNPLPYAIDPSTVFPKLEGVWVGTPLTGTADGMGGVTPGALLTPTYALFFDAAGNGLVLEDLEETTNLIASQFPAPPPDASEFVTLYCATPSQLAIGGEPDPARDAFVRVSDTLDLTVINAVAGTSITAGMTIAQAFSEIASSGYLNCSLQRAIAMYSGSVESSQDDVILSFAATYLPSCGGSLTKSEDVNGIEQGRFQGFLDGLGNLHLVSPGDGDEFPWEASCGVEVWADDTIAEVPKIPSAPSPQSPP